MTGNKEGKRDNSHLNDNVDQSNKKKVEDFDQENVKKKEKKRKKKKKDGNRGKIIEKSAENVKIGNQGTININKEMNDKGLRRNKKLVELKLRGIDEHLTDADDKILSYLQMRQYLRTMRRFRGLVYFYQGEDHEHALYDEGTGKVIHLYYESDSPIEIANRLFKYMYLDRLISNKSKRDELFRKINAERERKQAADLMELSDNASSTT